MSTERPAAPTNKLDKLLADERQRREHSYREQALKLYPWVCARCGREFSGKRLSELTVHHRDHNHDNNPPDGSNWELLCLYCHDNEHSRYTDQQWHSEEQPGARREPGATYKALAGIGDLLKREE
jgi:ribosomal protein L37AE/L43A